MEGGRAPLIIVLSLGAAVLGGPDALRALAGLAGRGPVLDITTCLLLIGMLAAQLLGVALLARFVRKPRAQRPRRAPAAGCLLARMTLAVSTGVAFSVAACLVLLPGGGMTTIAPDFAWTSPVVAAAGFLLLCFTRLLRVLRDGHVAARATKTRWTVCLLAGIFLLVAAFAAPGGLDALRRSSAACPV
jgi:hypothetical protein